MNKVILDGYVVKSEKSNSFHYFPANGDKHALCRFSLRNRRPYAKKGDDGFYPYDFYQCKAFGKQADLVGNLKHGDAIIIDGRMTIEDGYEKDGKQYPPSVVILAENVEYATTSNKNTDSAATNATAAAPTNNVFGSPTISRPAAPKATSPFSPF